MRHRTYSDEALACAVMDSRSYAEVLRRLGLSSSGSSWENIKRAIERNCLDCSHFGPPERRGCSPSRLSPSDVLVRGTLRKTKQLRAAMVALGTPLTCAICGLSEMWNGLPLVLEIDHIDGDHTNHEFENLRFLCPNCHSQQPTTTKRLKHPARLCMDCKVIISRQSQRCRECAQKNRTFKTKIEWPSPEELQKMLASHGGVVARLARELGVSDVALCKRLRAYKSVAD